MARTKYTAEFKAKIVLKVLQGEQELGEISAENNLNPNMVRKWKKTVQTDRAYGRRIKRGVVVI